MGIAFVLFDDRVVPSDARGNRITHSNYGQVIAGVVERQKGVAITPFLPHKKVEPKKALFARKSWTSGAFARQQRHHGAFVDAEWHPMTEVVGREKAVDITALLLMPNGTQ